MARSTTLHTGSSIDTRDFQRFALGLRKIAPEARKKLRRELVKAGEIVAREARAIASEHSTSIPPSVKVRTYGARVIVQAGGPAGGGAALAKELFGAGYGTTKANRSTRSLERKAEGTPLAYLFEIGNEKGGKEGLPGTFRHPVFGDREDWVSQQKHPFLTPAVAKNIGHVTDRVEAALTEAVDIAMAGLKHG
jgi:hypothetical protein